MSRLSPSEVLDCAGRAENGTSCRFAAKRRRRFRMTSDALDQASVQWKSGVALRFPPQSKTRDGAASLSP
jgi:hypothetical protein